MKNASIKLVSSVMLSVIASFAMGYKAGETRANEAASAKREEYFLTNTSKWTAGTCLRHPGLEKLLPVFSGVTFRIEEDIKEYYRVSGTMMPDTSGVWTTSFQRKAWLNSFVKVNCPV